MVTLLLDSAQLEIALSRGERILSFRKRNIEIPRSSIVKVQLVDDTWSWLRGVRAPGMHVRGVVAVGTWRSASGDDFVLVRRRGPGVVIDLDDRAEFQRIILTTRHGPALVHALRLDIDKEPTDVAELAEDG